MRKIGIIGLGNMGRGMALSLRRNGYAVLGFDLSDSVTEGLREHRIEPRKSIRDITRDVDILILSLPTSEIVEEVVLGEDGVAAHAKPGLILVDTTTADPNSTRKLALVLSKANIRFVDAPLSGGASGALSGTMTMVVGGSGDDVAAIRTVLEALSAKHYHVGPSGSGHVVKLINNLLTGIHLLATSEAVRLAESAGIKSEDLITALNEGSGRNSATLTNYPKWILSGSYDSGFTMKLMRKDMGLAIKLLKKTDITAPISIVAGGIWADSSFAIDDADDFNMIVNFIKH